MIMQAQQTNEELCNLFIQSIETKNEQTILKILECDDEATIRDIINRVPVHHVRKLILELRNVLSDQLTTNHLQWLQQVLILKFSAIASMADSRSIILPLISLLDDRSSPAYYMKMQSLKGKLSLLKQLKETRTAEAQETVVRVPADQSPHMDVDTESDTDSEEDFDDNEDDADEEEDQNDGDKQEGSVMENDEQDLEEDREETDDDGNDEGNHSDEDI